MTSIIKLRGASLNTPGLKLTDLPFTREKLFIWLGGEVVELSSNGVDTIIDYQIPSERYVTKGLGSNVSRLCSIETVNGLPVLHARPESLTGTPSVYNLPSTGMFSGHECLTFVFLVKAEAQAYPAGYRALLSVSFTNGVDVMTPFIRLQFNNNNVMNLVTRHSSTAETATQVSTDNLPAGYNVVMFEVNYAEGYIRTKQNSEDIRKITAFTGFTGPNIIPDSSVGGLLGYITVGGGTAGGSQFSGFLREMCVFSGQLSDEEIESVFSWQLSRRSLLNS